MTKVKPLRCEWKVRLTGVKWLGDGKAALQFAKGSSFNVRGFRVYPSADGVTIKATKEQANEWMKLRKGTQAVLQARFELK